MLKFEKGNIVTGDYVIFCQQVNCRRKMGAGLALQIRNKYPEVYTKYMNTETQKLGCILPVYTSDGRVCINMFSQYNYGRDGKRYTDYDAFKKCLNEIEYFLKDCLLADGATIAFPYKIGCGLAGGDWNVIQNLIKAFSEKVSQDVVIVSME